MCKPTGISAGLQAKLEPCELAGYSQTGRMKDHSVLPPKENDSTTL
jgi:hypothetical protein